MTSCIEDGDARPREGGMGGQLDHQLGEHPDEGCEEGGTRPDAGDEWISPLDEEERDGPLGNFPTRSPGLEGDERGHVVEGRPNVGMRASSKVMSTPSGVLRASVKVSRQVVKLSRPIASDVRRGVSEGNAAWSSATAL